MASVYVLGDTVKARLGDRADAALDRDRDGDEDDGLLDELIAEAGDEINMRLAQRLQTPFADLPSTPSEIQRIALWLVLADCYAWIEPNGRDHEVFREKANATLTALAEGKADLPSQRRTSAHAAGHVAIYTSEGATFAGTTASGSSRIRGI
jgi:phage gp36-like protein